MTRRPDQFGQLNARTHRHWLCTTHLIKFLYRGYPDIAALLVLAVLDPRRLVCCGGPRVATKHGGCFGHSDSDTAAVAHAIQLL